MRMALLTLAVLAQPALAGPVCTFTEECYMTLDCQETDYVVTVDDEAGVLTTMVQDLDILHDSNEGNRQIVARGMGSIDLLTIGPATAILTAHIGSGPASITYYGVCE